MSYSIFIYLILVLIVIIAVAVFLLDFIYNFSIWQSRIHIGRYQDTEKWEKAILNKSLQWLYKTPTIKFTDNNRLIIIDILRGDFRKDTIQLWQEASLLLGLKESYLKTKDPVIKKRIDDYLNSKLDNTGNWKKAPKEIDGAILAYAILQLEWIDKLKYKAAFDKIIELINDLVGEDDTVQYRKNMSNYRYVDTIGFICPFLVSYGIKFNDSKSIGLAVRQITEYNNYGMLDMTSIPFHTYNINNNLPVGLLGWGRGLGWYAIGLIDAWNALPNENEYKQTMTEFVVKFTDTVLRFQNEDGSWNWIVNSKESRADSSATATLTWFLFNASKIESITKECQASIEKGINYLKSVTRRNGAVDFSQGDTKGIGVYSKDFDILPFTQGFVLRTLSNF